MKEDSPPQTQRAQSGRRENQRLLCARSVLSVSAAVRCLSHTVHSIENRSKGRANDSTTDLSDHAARRFIPASTSAATSRVINRLQR